MSDNSDEFTVAEDAMVIYNGLSKVLSYGRDSKNGQWFKVSALDSDQFNESMKRLSGQVAVYVTIAIDGDMVMQDKEFLLKTASSSSRSANNYRLQHPEIDNSLYDEAKIWCDEGKDIYIAIIKGEYTKDKPIPSGEHIDMSKEIRGYNYLSHVEFLKLVGPESKYLRWINEQKCALSGSFYLDEETGRELCEAAHVREIGSGAGTAVKPMYYAIPLHHKLHRWQHEHSMTELWARNSYSKGCPKNKHYRRLAPDTDQYPILSNSRAAHAFFMHQVHGYMRKWVEHEIITWAGVSRLSYVSREKYEAYLTSIGAESYIC